MHWKVSSIIYFLLPIVFTQLPRKLSLALELYLHKNVLKKSCLTGKSILQVPDTGTRILDNTKLFWRSGIVCFWMPPARSKERKYHVFRQYWYTRNVPVFTNTGMFQYLGPEVYFFRLTHPVDNAWSSWYWIRHKFSINMAHSWARHFLHLTPTHPHL